MSGGRNFLQAEALGAYTRHLSERLRYAVRQSLILRVLCGVYPKWERRFRQARFLGSREGEPISESRQFRLRERVRPLFEESVLYRATEACLRVFSGAPLWAYALFFSTFALSSIGMRWLLLSSPPSVNEIMFASFTVIVTLPARASRQPLWKALEGSLLLGGLFREAARTRPAWNAKRIEGGTARTPAILLAAVSLGTLSVLCSARDILLFGGVAALLFCVWLTPELGIPLLMAIFPFAHLLAHSTTVLLALSLWIELAYFAKALVGRRTLTLGVTDFLVLLFGVCYLCAALVGSGGSQGLVTGIGRFVAVAFWFPVRNLMGQRRWREHTLFAVTLSAAVCASIGVYQYFFGELELKWVDASRFSDIGGRVVATFSNPNILAVYLLTVLPICLGACMRYNRRAGGRAVGALSLISVLGCILLTWTRAAWLASPIVIALFLLCYSRCTALMSLLLALPVASLLPLLPGRIVNRFVSIGRASDSSVCYRLYTWKGTLRLIWHHPWGIGTGQASFDATYPHFAVSGTESVPHTHQLFLQIAAELGVAAALVFCALLVSLSFAFFYALSRSRGEARGTVLATACGVVGCLILGLFDYIWYDPAMTLLFFFSAGVAVSLTERYAWEEGWQ